MSFSKIFAATSSLALCLCVAACAEVPDNPTIDVMPTPGQSWESFSAQRNYCNQQASQRVGHAVGRSNTRGIIGGVVTTALGAGIGAAAGGGMGAALGAGAGALAGTAVGGYYSNSQNGDIQQSYNIAYVQCMQAYHNQESVVGYSAPSPAYVQGGRVPGRQVAPQPYGAYQQYQPPYQQPAYGAYQN